MKKVISLILCVLMLGSCFAFADTIEGSRTVIGADLDADEVASVYKEFGIPQGDVKELTVTNAEEREYLKGLVDESLIGTKSISCVYIEALSEGKGLDVTVKNITWCTPDMYMNAMVTAGITDANVRIVAPFNVSGTAALTGIYKAYEEKVEQVQKYLKDIVSKQGEIKQFLSNVADTVTEFVNKVVDFIRGIFG